MARYSSRYTQKPGKGNSFAAILIVAGVLLIVGVVYLMAIRKSDEVDPQGCLRDQPIKGNTVFLLDRTDAYDKTVRPILKEVLQDVAIGLKTNERLSIYGIQEASNDIPVRLFTLCSPGNKFNADIIKQTPEKIQAKFERNFLPRLMTFVDRQLDITHSVGQSRIIEGLNFVTELQEFQDTATPKKLVLFSDLLENSRLLDHVTSSTIPSFEDVKAINYFPMPDFGQIDVTVYYLANPRFKSRQNSKHIRFWRDFLTDESGAGANSIIFRQL